MSPLAAQLRVFAPVSSLKGRYHAPRQPAACLNLAGGVLFPPSLPCDCSEPRPVLKLSSFAASSGFCPSNERQPTDIPAPVYPFHVGHLFSVWPKCGLSLLTGHGTLGTGLTFSPFDRPSRTRVQRTAATVATIGSSGHTGASRPSF
ncbi:hypothetical protein FB451DRAFT_1565732 [Mycena latifolia]|nr:hypothetical protein FB451DRAFT_1565732 [Mycena latifolia]